MTFRVRGALSFAAVVITLTADYWIVHRPEPHGVAEFNPIKAALGREELILANPAPSGSSLLSRQITHPNSLPSNQALSHSRANRIPGRP